MWKARSAFTRPVISSATWEAGRTSVVRAGRHTGAPEQRGHVGDVLVAPAAEADQHRLRPAAQRPRRPAHPGEGVGGLQRGNDALEPAQRLERIERLRVGGRLVAHPPGVAQIAVLRPHAGIVEPGRDRVRRRDLAVGVLQQIAQAAVQHAGRAGAQGGAVMAGPDALARRLDADQLAPRSSRKRGEDARSRSSRRRRRRPPSRGSRPKRSSICSRASRPITDWKSRTMRGIGIGARPPSR